jgi:two-component system, chemotaxis family, chemotaxis protein CheY
MLKDASVLLVEDVRSMRLMIYSALRSFGMEVFEAAGGAAAVEVLSIRDVQFIITDLLMQPLDGLSLIRILRAPGTARPMTHISLSLGMPSFSCASAAPPASTNRATKPLPKCLIGTPPNSDPDVPKVKAAFAACASDFIVKPVIPSDLKLRLERLVARPPDIVRTADYHGPQRRRRAVYVRRSHRTTAQQFTELD